MHWYQNGMQDWALSTTQEHRGRLLRAMAQAVSEQGYAQTTIADVVRLAGVSRRTFYEHFGGKAECLVALYETANRNALRVLREAIGAAGHRGRQGGRVAATDRPSTALVKAVAHRPAGVIGRRK